MINADNDYTFDDKNTKNHAHIHSSSQPARKSDSQPAHKPMHASMHCSFIHARIHTIFTDIKPVMAGLEVRPFGLSSQRKPDPMPLKPRSLCISLKPCRPTDNVYSRLLTLPETLLRGRPIAAPNMPPLDVLETLFLPHHRAPAAGVPETPLLPHRPAPGVTLKMPRV